MTNSISHFAPTPPMGWNSWDCFGVNVTEAEVLANAEFMAHHLNAFGWEYVVVDLAWYCPAATKDNYKEPEIDMIIDDYGRLLPDPGRFPSAAGGQGFKPLADKIHALGLKFGIHIMRGIPWIARKKNTPILGSEQHAAEIAVPADKCLWFNSMDGINMTQPGGQAYYDSLLQLYTSWDVDFIKADDMNSWDGDGKIAPYHSDEIAGLSQAIQKTGRAIVLSLSPGAALPCNAQHLQDHANMWRISCDFWDDWEALKRQFARCANWATYTVPGHWPDADMLPFGRIGIRGEVGQERATYFTHDELYTLMTLWCICRSPLMFGGHLPDCDDFSVSLLANEDVLQVNQSSTNNRQLYRTDGAAVWAADSEDGTSHYVALFNLSESKRQVSVELGDLGVSSPCSVCDLWHKQDLDNVCQTFGCELPPHGAGLYRVSP